MKIHPEYSITELGIITSNKTGKVISVFNRHKYLAVALGSNRGTQKIYYLHRLLAHEFIPNPHGYPIINHIDGNKLNNDISNLEWTTYSGNNKHSILMGAQIFKYGEEHHSSKLTSAKVLEIRKLLIENEIPQQKIADYFGVSRGCILGIHSGKTWQNNEKPDSKRKSNRT